MILYLLMPITIISISVIIAVLHMIAPDHWTPILSHSLQKRIKKERVAGISFSLGLLHGIFSSLLSFGIAVLGFYIFPERYVKILAAVILILVIFYIIINAHYESEKTGINDSILLVSVIPDPAFVPIILIALIYGINFVYFAMIVFILASALALLAVTVPLSRIISKYINKLKPQHIDYIVSIILGITVLFLFI
ncbi:hypothetical protein [Picrophilus oshimae]|uniref:Uncharacterized protein n=1 Tax=Picrophilus torridus (strain ATCC 700027 / DSM 9790 / JCM 10055 / NBRC 100828 / KAW 2/3) TaxID=1122961 RepID=Q6L0Z4_PICTO|nr:hypothetical protein [Picrophilus oshimae]AAT43358.1 hypothetical protein PTO0773 [Picrophilus oshimae DSM 9789]